MRLLSYFTRPSSTFLALSSLSNSSTPPQSSTPAAAHTTFSPSSSTSFPEQQQQQQQPMRTWDTRYSTEDYAYGTEPNSFLKYYLSSIPLREYQEQEQQLAKKKNAKCLLLAEGEGHNAVYMAQQGWDVTAVDSSAVGLRKAQALAAQKQVQISTIHADLADYDLQAGSPQWHCIVGIFCHLTPSTRQRVLRAIPQALKPGGYVIFECYTPQQPTIFNTGGPHSVDLLYTAKMFQEAFGDQLEILVNREVVREVLEGRYHIGKGAVVQFMGRKPNQPRKKRLAGHLMNFSNIRGGEQESSSEQKEQRPKSLSPPSPPPSPPAELSSFEERKTAWLERYGSLQALQRTFGTGPQPWGDLSPTETRRLYHTLLPRTLLALAQDVNIKSSSSRKATAAAAQLAPLAYAARVAAKEYARSRCIWPARFATIAFDKWRSIGFKKRVDSPSTTMSTTAIPNKNSSSSPTSWDSLWEKYRAQILQEHEQEQQLQLQIEAESKSRKKKDKDYKIKPLNEEELTMRTYLRILERSCKTNQAVDQMFLQKGNNDGTKKSGRRRRAKSEEEDDDFLEEQLQRMTQQLEDDVREILLHPKERERLQKYEAKTQRKEMKAQVKEEKEQLQQKEKQRDARKKTLQKAIRKAKKKSQQ